MDKFNEEFLEDEDIVFVIPTCPSSKPVKIVYENRYKIEATDNPMEYVFSRKASLEEMASDMEMTLEELLEAINER